jgi:hypothetical protein
MKKTAILLTVTTALAAETFTGLVTDTMCGTRHSMMKIEPDARCVRECIKMDKRWKYALHDGKKMYVLSDQQTPEKFAAQKVKVTGTLYTKTNIIKVDKIEPLVR